MLAGDSKVSGCSVPSKSEVRVELISRIEKAFAGVVLSDGVTLHEAAALEGYASEIECAEARRLDAGRNWQDLTDEEIQQCGDVLSFLDELGLRFYLPAYMIWTIKHYEVSDLLTSHVICIIRDLRAELFTLDQCQAIQAYLNFLCEAYNDSDACDALAGYWYRLPRHLAGTGLPQLDPNIRAKADPIEEAKRLSRINRLTDAISHIDSIIPCVESKVDRSQLFSILGECYKLRRELTQAREAFENAIRIHHANAAAHLEMGWLLLGKCEDLWMDHFSNALQLAPETSGIAMQSLPAHLKEKVSGLSIAGDFVVNAHLALAVAFADSKCFEKSKREVEMAVRRSGHRMNLVPVLYSEIAELVS